MIDLERRALLGDRQAQGECARRGIVLACPFCGGEASVSCDPDGTVDAMGRTWAYTVVCNKCCATSGLGFSQIMMIEKWNTRHAPPIGRCKDCEHYTLLGHCKIHSQEPDEYATGAYVEMLPDDFCSYFEPKGDEENAAD